MATAGRYRAIASEPVRESLSRPRFSADFTRQLALGRVGCYLAALSRGTGMASTYETVAGIISDTCDIELDKITPDSHAINDLGIDSLDFLDVAFAIDKAFGIKMPLEQWTQEVNEGKVTTDEYFVLKNLCANIDKLVAAKAA
jgi:acyl carrier protein